jgi:hypothetical protein
VQCIGSIPHDVIQLWYLFFSYGSPSGNPLGPTNPNINPRLPGGINQRVYQVGAGSNPTPTIVNPDGSEVPDKIVLSEPGYGDFNKRSGLSSTMALGGKPRSLDVGEEEQRSRDAKSALKDVNTVDASSVSSFSLYIIAVHAWVESRAKSANIQESYFLIVK